MSATRDKSQKFQFVYSNLYNIYKKGRDAAKEAAVSDLASPLVLGSSGLTQGSRVLKSGDAHQIAAQQISKMPPVPAASAPQIREYSPIELIGKRVNRPDVLPPVENPTLNSLRDNLKSLNDLHSRLRFMLQELEELIEE